MVAPEATTKWRALWSLALAELLAMGLWFSATAVVPALMAHWHVPPERAAWLTMAVQLGFVTGAVANALFNVADIWEPRHVLAIAATAGATVNAAIAFTDPGFGVAVVLRFFTGAALAFVYPVGMKIMATWTREDRGLGLGLLVGALTVGSASPHLLHALGEIGQWQPVLYAASALAVAGAVIAWRTGHTGPFGTPNAVFRWRYMARALTERPLRLANGGYLGHMWELYAMWTWIPLFFTVVYGGERPAAFAAFAVIAVGGVGSLLAGRLADRWGRTRTTILSMVISGTCAIIIGWAANFGPTAALIVALIWGFAIVADSAQFSTAVSELAQPEYMGTMLAIQTAMGFLLTLASIQLVPVLVRSVGWPWAFAALALGPASGCWSMWRLRRSPAARLLAGGRG